MRRRIVFVVMRRLLTSLFNADKIVLSIEFVERGATICITCTLILAKSGLTCLKDEALS